MDKLVGLPSSTVEKVIPREGPNITQVIGRPAQPDLRVRARAAESQASVWVHAPRNRARTGARPRLLVRPLGHSVDGISGPRHELSFAGLLERRGSLVSQRHGVVGLECLRIRSRPLRDDEEVLRIVDMATGSPSRAGRSEPGLAAVPPATGLARKGWFSKSLAIGTALGGSG